MHKTDTHLNGFSLREQNGPSVMEVLISPGRESGLGSLNLLESDQYWVLTQAGWLGASYLTCLSLSLLAHKMSR